MYLTVRWVGVFVEFDDGDGNHKFPVRRESIILEDFFKEKTKIGEEVGMGLSENLRDLGHLFQDDDLLRRSFVGLRHEI